MAGQGLLWYVRAVVRVGLVSPYPPRRCGIGPYTRELVHAVLGAEDGVSVFVAGEEGAGPMAEGRLEVRECYRREDDYVDGLARALQAARVDVAHFQYAPDLFGEDDRLLRLLARLGAEGIRTVVTLHTVYGDEPLRRLLRQPSMARYYRVLGGVAGRVVVHHEEGMADRLVALGVPRQRVVVIPHGTTLIERREPAEARMRLGLPADAVVLTFFGFIHRLKNVHTAVEAFLRIAARNPKAVLLVSGMPWGDRWYNHLYVEAMRARIALSGHGDRALLRASYVEKDAVPDVYAASDVILLPHRQAYGSASGVFHQAIGGGRPVIVAKGPKFADAGRVLASVPELAVPAGDVGAWARAMECVVREPEVLRRGREAVRAYAEATTWPRVARQHLAEYHALCARP